MKIKTLLEISEGIALLTKQKGPFNPMTGQYEVELRQTGHVIGLKCARIMSTIDPILEDYNNQRRKLVNENTDPATEDAKGSRQFYDNIRREKFRAAERELQEMEVPVNLLTFTTKDLEKDWVTADAFFLLRPIITDFDTPATADGPKKEEEAA